jgi:type I restriction enzyme S subunit
MGIVSTAYSVFRPDTSNYDPTYLDYLLRIDKYVAQYLIASKGIWISRLLLNDWAFLRLPIISPSLPEQTRIASFLDRKTAQIDQAIAQKERLIELLKERKQIMIQQAVTRGLNPDVEMKDSGVEWIGEIPAHWEVRRLKFVLAERNERSKSGEEPLLMMSQTHGLVVRSDFHDKAEVAQSSEGNKLVFFNDLVFNKLKAHLGVFFKSNIEGVGIVSPDYAVYYSKSGIEDLKYLEYLFRHPAYIYQFITRATGIVEGLIRLYTGDLFDIKIPIAAAKEQLEILRYIDKNTVKFKIAIGKAQAQIAYLKELKSTLINSAVTGKIKV